MTHKKLTRDQKWGFQYYPYHQVHIESEIFTGWAALNYLTDGRYLIWDMQKAGKIPVAGEGMCWLTLIPDNQSRSILVIFTKERRISCLYVDVIEEIEFYNDGLLGFVDKYLDVIITPQGDVNVVDRDELDEAYNSGELTEQQYKDAIAEGERIVAELGSDIPATEKWCTEVLKIAEEKTKSNFTIFLDLQDKGSETQDKIQNLKKRTMGTVVDIFGWSKSGKVEKLRNYLKENPQIKKYAVLSDWAENNYSSDEAIKNHLVLVDVNEGLEITDLMRVSDIMNSVKL